jgi:copper chaperone CopZ
VRVTAALKSVPCVRNVEINFAGKEAYVTADKKTLDTDALIAALKKAGYDATVKGEPSP